MVEEGDGDYDAVALSHVAHYLLLPDNRDHEERDAAEGGDNAHKRDLRLLGSVQAYRIRSETKSLMSCFDVAPEPPEGAPTSATA